MPKYLSTNFTKPTVTIYFEGSVYVSLCFTGVIEWVNMTHVTHAKSDPFNPLTITNRPIACCVYAGVGHTANALHTEIAIRLLSKKAQQHAFGGQDNLRESVPKCQTILGFAAAGDDK